MTLPQGTRLGRYEVRSQLGVGGMGEVYLAEDRKLGRTAALKILPAEVAADQARMHRFVQEARLASSLDHPHLATIYEIEDEAEPPFIATEFIQGVTLRERMKGGAVSQGEVLRLGEQIASALSAAHEAGVVHRDVTPENVMLRPDGYVKVLYFRLAKLAAGRNGEAADGEAPTLALVHTAPGMVMGTVSYMSPEQAAGLADVDGRTDVWSLGVLLYELLAGRVPFWFEGAPPTQIISMITQKQVPPLKQFAPRVPDELSRIVMKALENKRDERYQSMKELLVDLRRLGRQLEREAELERSLTPGPDEAARAADAQTRAMSTQSAAASTAGGGPTRPTRSAEHLASRFGRRRTVVALASLVLAVAIVAAAYGFYRLLWREPPPFQSIRIEKLTNIGNATAAQISPDGQYIAHAVYEVGKYSLRVWHVATKSGVEIVPPSEAPLAVSSFSPDSRYIYFLRADVAPGFSPDGRWVIYHSAATSDLRKVPVEAGESVRLTDQAAPPPTGLSRRTSAVSPVDGRIAGLSRAGESSRPRLAVFPPEGGAPTMSFDLPPGTSREPRWSRDGSAIIYLIDRARSSSRWSRPVEGGAPKPLADFTPEQIFYHRHLARRKIPRLRTRDAPQGRGADHRVRTMTPKLSQSSRQGSLGGRRGQTYKR